MVTKYLTDLEQYYKLTEELQKKNGYDTILIYCDKLDFLWRHFGCLIDNDKIKNKNIVLTNKVEQKIIDEYWEKIPQLIELKSNMFIGYDCKINEHKIQILRFIGKLTSSIVSTINLQQNKLNKIDTLKDITPFSLNIGTLYSTNPM